MLGFLHIKAVHEYTPYVLRRKNITILRDWESKQANEPMAHGTGKLWAIYKTFGPLGRTSGSQKN